MTPTVIKLPAVRSQWVRAVVTPIISVLVALALALPAIVAGRPPATVPLILVIFFGGLGVLLLVLEWRDLRPRTITIDEAGVTLEAPGNAPVTVPTDDIESVRVVNLVPRQGSASTVRSAIEIIIKRGADNKALRLAPVVYQIVDEPTHESISMQVGEGAERQRSLDAQLRGVAPRYRGIADHHYDNRRVRFRRESRVEAIRPLF